MFNFILLFLLAVGMYTALIYTSPALILFVVTGLVLWTAMEAYVVILRFFLLGKIQIPIGVTDIGDQAVLRFRIRNRWFMPLKRVRLCVSVRDTFEGRSRRLWLKATGLERGENEVEYFVRLPEAGNYEFHLCAIRYYDPLGLLRGRAKPDSRKVLQVLPEIFPVPVALTIRVKNFFGDADVYDEEKAGYDNSETFRIRPYQKGDKPGAIHWKLSAKEDRLMVKESALPKACSVVLLLDERRTQWKGGYRFYKFLEVAASVSFSLMDAGCPHYVAWYEERMRDMTRIRVDDEESFYRFLAWYLTEQGSRKPEGLLDRYNDKYRSERYVSSLRITGDLRLEKDGVLLARLSPENYREELEGMELMF